MALKVAPSGIVCQNEDDVGGRLALGVAEAGETRRQRGSDVMMLSVADSHTAVLIQ